MEAKLTTVQWVKRILTENERTIENIEDLAHSFTRKDFLRVISSI